MAGLPAPPKDEAGAHLVYYDGSWVVANELVVLADAGQSRADVEAVIAPHGGKLRPSILEEGRMYVAIFPFDDAKRLVEIRHALESAGFHSSMQWLGNSSLGSHRAGGGLG